MALSQTRLSISSSFSYLLPLYLGTALVCSYAVASLPGTYFLAALLLAGLFAVAQPGRPHPRLFYLIITTALIIPPFYLSALPGQIPIHICSLLLLALALMVSFRLEIFRLNWDSIGEAGLYLLLAMALSLPFAYWLSGVQVGIQSSLRFLLVLQPWFLYAWICTTGWVEKDEQLTRFVRFLLIVGAAAATYGIIDFYFPFPFSHPFADQYIFLQGEKIRRAQGLFYEASSFGNLCAFFLTLSLLQLYSLRKGSSLLHLSGLFLLVGIFFTALFLAYSRGSWANVMMTVTVFLALQRALQIRRLAALLVLMAAFGLLLYQVSPGVVANFFEWRLANLLEFWNDPSFATSGRWETWERLITFFADHPWLLLFGIGYKSLPHTDLFGTSLIADNGFLSLAFETGITGFIAFLNLNWVIFRSLHQTTQHQNSTVRRYGAFMFAFWCGEMVQMMTGDIFTFWRNVILYFSLIALVQRLSRQDRVRGRTEI
jgi:O-antigen ligase